MNPAIGDYISGGFFRSWCLPKAGLAKIANIRVVVHPQFTI
jgi:hypothetical protein